MNIEYNMRGVLHAFFRHKTKILLIFMLFAAAGAAVVLTARPVYEARGSLLVKFGRGAVPDANRPDGSRPAELARDDRSEIMKSNVKILRSHALLGDIAAAMGMDAPDSSGNPEEKKESKEIELQKAVARLTAALDVRADDNSNIIELSVRDEDPEKAARIANLLIDRFIVRQAELYNASQAGFLDKQVEAMKESLDRSREEFSIFKKETGISAIDEEMNQLLREKSELTALAFQSVAEAQATLAALEAREAEMRATYQSNSSVMVRLRDSISFARKQLAERRSDLNVSGQEDSSLSGKIGTIDERIAWLEEQRGRYNELEQRVKMDEENYRYYQQRGEEARVNNLLNAENITRISVIDRPVAPLYPVSPLKKLIALAFLMAGLLIGLGTALTLELLDDRIALPEQASSVLGLPVLATFGKIKEA